MFTARDPYNLRSQGFSYGPPRVDAPQNSGYQPPPPLPQKTASSPFQPASSSIDDIAATLDSIGPKINSIKPDTDFHITVSNILRLVVAQLKEIKVEQHRQRQTTESTFRQFDMTMFDMTRAVAKGEQYNRRDSAIVVGLPKNDTETEDTLATAVAEQLSKSGETVTPEDFTAVHRNGKVSKTIKGKVVPPSVTVKFSVISKKDKVLRSYRNYDSVTKKPKTVKMYQSLSPHYAGLRQAIYKFFDTDNEANNLGKQIKWCTYQSPTAGLVVKLKSDEYMRDIHLIDEFYIKFRDVCK